ncbi:cyclin-like protein, partial [Endogone sp. FLAS-F59071]
MDLYCDEMDLDPPQLDSRRPLKNLSNAHRHQHSKAARKYAPYSTTHSKGDVQAQTAAKTKQWPSAADNIFVGISMRSYATETHSRRYKPVQHFEHNPWYWNEYAQDVYSHLRDIEKIHRPRTSYMSKQTEINSNMRAILVDWLMEVASELKLSGETLYMANRQLNNCFLPAVNYTDRFLSSVRVIRTSFQCVGIAALFVASKYEEVNPPFLSDLVEITDRTYTERQILGMEQKILKILRFELTVASVSSFAAYFIRATEADERVVAFVNYLSDLTLLDYTFLKFLPSEIAASASEIAVVIALHTFRHTYW